MCALTDKGKQSYKDKRHSKKKESENAVKKARDPTSPVGIWVNQCLVVSQPNYNIISLIKGR